ncbi:MAG: UpxY family transcription antiterminator [Muribaculaceae bacterium]|nr:UpxY family transcription antiterminator [Muribaculaceae bacterium]
MKVKADFDSRGIESFVPMYYKKILKNGVLYRKLVPSVHNLIFAYMTPEAMKEYKLTTQMPIRYIMNKETHKPLLVLRRQMENFITVAGKYDQEVLYLSPNPGDFSKGDRVRILGGVFEGAEGVFVRVKGDRRVVVSIDGVVAVATTFVHPSMIERIDNE